VSWIPRGAGWGRRSSTGGASTWWNWPPPPVARCSSGVSAVEEEVQKAMTKRVGPAGLSAASESNLNLAEQLWKIRMQECKQGPSAEEEALRWCWLALHSEVGTGRGPSYWIVIVWPIERNAEKPPKLIGPPVLTGC